MPRLLCFGLLAVTLLSSRTSVAQQHSVEPGIAVQAEILELPRDRYEQLRWMLEAVARASGSETGTHNRVTVIGVFDGEELNRLLSDVRSKPAARVESFEANHVFKIQDRMPEWDRSDSKTPWMGTLQVTTNLLEDGEWSLGLKPDTEIDKPNANVDLGLSSGPGPRRLRMRPGQVAVIEHPYDFKAENLPKRRFVEVLLPVGSSARERRRQTDAKRLILVQAH